MVPLFQDRIFPVHHPVHRHHPVVDLARCPPGSAPARWRWMGSFRSPCGGPMARCWPTAPLATAFGQSGHGVCFFLCVCVCVTRFATAIFWLLALGCFRNRRSNLLINGTLVGGTMQTPYCYSPSYWSLSSWVVAITGFGWRSAILPDFGVRLILPKFKLRDNIPERYQIVIELERDRDRTRQRPI